MNTPTLHFTKQALMRKVLISLIPLVVAAVYFFGWRSLALIGVSAAAALAAEWSFKRKGNKPVSEAVFVSAVLYALTLPARTPFWVAALGIAFGIVFAKEVFGGFGRNVFNPALVGRAFVYVNFPAFLTIQWTQPFSGFPGGFAGWLGTPVDTLSTATPMLAFRATGSAEALQSLFFGNVSGSLGETSALLILLAAAYLIVTKTASWEIMAATVLGFLASNAAFYALGFSKVPDPLTGLLSGGLLFGAVFMATDPISSPKTRQGKWLYGLLIGLVTVIIRGFALFAGGMMFAILIANTFVPILDEAVKGLLARPRPGKEAAR